MNTVGKWKAYLCLWLTVHGLRRRVKISHKYRPIKDEHYRAHERLHSRFLILLFMGLMSLTVTCSALPSLIDNQKLIPSIRFLMVFFVMVGFFLLISGSDGPIDHGLKVRDAEVRKEIIHRYGRIKQ